MVKKDKDLKKDFLSYDSQNLEITNVEVGTDSVNYSAKKAENYVEFVEQQNEEE